MTPSGLAVLVLLSFLLPVPILSWLDRPRREVGHTGGVRGGGDRIGGARER